MNNIFPAPFAKLLELDFALDLFFVLSAPVIDTFTIRAGKFYEFILRHDNSLC